MQDVRVKLKFYDDYGDKQNIIRLVFNNDDEVEPQIDRWLKANLLGVESWKIVDGWKME